MAVLTLRLPALVRRTRQLGEWLDLTDAVGKPTIAGLIAADAIERQFTGRTDEQVAMAACEALQAWAAAVGPTP